MYIAYKNVFMVNKRDLLKKEKKKWQLYMLMLTKVDVLCSHSSTQLKHVRYN